MVVVVVVVRIQIQIHGRSISISLAMDLKLEIVLGHQATQIQIQIQIELATITAAIRNIDLTINSRNRRIRRGIGYNDQRTARNDATLDISQTIRISRYIWGYIHRFRVVSGAESANTDIVLDRLNVDVLIVCGKKGDDGEGKCQENGGKRGG